MSLDWEQWRGTSGSDHQWALVSPRVGKGWWSHLHKDSHRLVFFFALGQQWHPFSIRLALSKQERHWRECIEWENVSPRVPFSTTIRRKNVNWHWSTHPPIALLLWAHVQASSDAAVVLEHTYRHTEASPLFMPIHFPLFVFASPFECSFRLFPCHLRTHQGALCCLLIDDYAISIYSFWCDFKTLLGKDKNN